MKLRSSFESRGCEPRVYVTCWPIQSLQPIENEHFLNRNLRAKKYLPIVIFVVCFFSGSIQSAFRLHSWHPTDLSSPACSCYSYGYIVTFHYQFVLIVLDALVLKTMEENGTGRCNAQRGNGAVNRGQKTSLIRFALQDNCFMYKHPVSDTNLAVRIS